MCRVAALVVLFCFIIQVQADVGQTATAGYDAGQLLSKIFHCNDTQLRGLIKFENQLDSDYAPLDDQKFFDDDRLMIKKLKFPNTIPFKFQNDQEANIRDTIDDNGPTNINFGQEATDNRINGTFGNRFPPTDGKKKRRKRKPKRQFPSQSGFLDSGYPGPVRPPFGPGQSFGPTAGPNPNFGPASGPGPSFQLGHLQPGSNGEFYRPPRRRRPQPSLASDALAAVTGALTSIAHNDDYQCVARLLCEAAAGRAPEGSSLLDSISGLQPLLTLLSAYNGVSSNPLFVFGRAAFLGMSSKGNPGSCRYAYPLCPTDPEQLVHYLNNHNGGFFRFFNAPQNGQQNLEQFYNQLSHNYGLYQPYAQPGSNPEFYGLVNPGLHPNPEQANLYSNGYGYQQNYGFAYPYSHNYNNGIRFKNDNRNKQRLNADGNKIENRIQNKPTNFVNDNSVINNSKWLFPGEDDGGDESEIGVQYVNDDEFEVTDIRKGKTLKFPDDITTNTDYGTYNNIQPINYYTTETIRKPKAIAFPEMHSNHNNYNSNEYYNPIYSNYNRFQFNNVNREENKEVYKEVNYYNSQVNYREHQEEPGVTTVYVVRGNGDPSRPDIVKLRPGETISDKFNKL